MYEEAYNVMILMARANSIWVNIEDNTIRWAKSKNILWKLYDEIEKSIVNNTININYRERSNGYLQKIKEIRGY